MPLAYRALERLVGVDPRRYRQLAVGYGLSPKRIDTSVKTYEEGREPVLHAVASGIERVKQGETTPEAEAVCILDPPKLPWEQRYYAWLRDYGDLVLYNVELLPKSVALPRSYEYRIVAGEEERRCWREPERPAICVSYAALAEIERLYWWLDEQDATPAAAS